MKLSFENRLHLNKTAGNLSHVFGEGYFIYDEYGREVNAFEQEKDKHLRLFAEFENFKKRTAKERIELFKTASKEVLSAMIPVLDDFNRAQKQFETDEKVIDNEGFNLISNKFKEISFFTI